jgi:hypothetical protein
MTVMDALGAPTISVRIEPEQDTGNLRPLRSLFRCIKEPNIEREVLSIIICQAGALRRLIVKRDAGHCAGPVLLGGDWMASSASDVGAEFSRERLLYSN